MKNITLLFVLLAFVSITNAQIYLDETFNYSVTKLADETSWTHAVSPVGSTLNGTGRSILEQALVYSNSGKEYRLSAEGKTIHSDYLNTASVTNTSIKKFNDSIKTTIYLSFLFKAGIAQGQTQSTVLGLAMNTNVASTLWVGKGALNTTDYRFGVTRSSTTGADVKWISTEYTDVEAVHFIVLKHDFETGFTSLYVNPAIGGTEPTTPTATDNAGTARRYVNNLMFRNSGNNKAVFDVSGVRISGTWAEAVASKSASSIGKPIEALGSGFSISPNPAVGTATLSFELSQTENLSCSIYDIAGSLVKTVFSAPFYAGSNRFSLDVSDIPSGVYFCRLTDGKGSYVKKLTVN